MANLKALTPKKKQRFLDALRTTCNVSKSAQIAGVSRTTVYQTLKHDENFKREFGEAREMALDALEDKIVERAYEGAEKPIFFQGKQVATVKECSDTLAMFYLKGQRPQYREHVQISGKIDYLADMTIEQMISIALEAAEPARIKTIEPKMIEHQPKDDPSRSDSTSGPLTKQEP